MSARDAVAVEPTPDVEAERLRRFLRELDAEQRRRETNDEIYLRAIQRFFREG
jgi:hypothetical protein